MTFGLAMFVFFLNLLLEDLSDKTMIMILTPIPIVYSRFPFPLCF